MHPMHTHFKVQVTGMTVKISPCRPQKWPQEDGDTGIREFTKCTRQYDLQQKNKASALIGKAIVCAMSPTKLQMLVGYCRVVDEVAHN